MQLIITIFGEDFNLFRNYGFNPKSIEELHKNLNLYVLEAASQFGIDTGKVAKSFTFSY